MPDLIIIRLHPVEPIAGADFSNYLGDLTITAFDISFEHPEVVEIGQAIIVHHLTTPDDPLDPPKPLAVATAVIEMNPPPANYPEHKPRITIASYA